MKTIFKKIFEWLFAPIRRRTIDSINDAIETNRILTARLLIGNMQQDGQETGLQSKEFRVFSQAGEDGIIQYLI